MKQKFKSLFTAEPLLEIFVKGLSPKEKCFKWTEALTNGTAKMNGA